ncbi:hypothetical protein RUM44_006125 [Polyplax serrata]|uniref:C2H2-type domain-containing protein n=1 Tax=Polyplax serrata TaxID=468196 RepID=A0ABR1AZ18_POLSC
MTNGILQSSFFTELRQTHRITLLYAEEKTSGRELKRSCWAKRPKTKEFELHWKEPVLGDEKAGEKRWSLLVLGIPSQSQNRQIYHCKYCFNKLGGRERKNHQQRKVHEPGKEDCNGEKIEKFKDLSEKLRKSRSNLNQIRIQ